MTSSFGVSRREAHDARPFYARFKAPELSTDETVEPSIAPDDPFVCGDARDMHAIGNGSVALVVTSPPYFAGKRYEEELDRDGVPGSYLEYLQLLRDVFAECRRVLEPGGRLAVNVANLGRKPYRSLSSDVMAILQDDLHLLPRGEIIWQKGDGASGSCAWGSFRSPANPVLRDITERILVVSKGRFDRAKSAKERQRLDLPHESDIWTEDFMRATLDVWDIPPESARRVQHPAPFPVELPARLIQLYTYRGDLVLDPFMGSGSTLVAAAQTDRRYVGYDLDPTYVGLARTRVRLEGGGLDQGNGSDSSGGTGRLRARAANQGKSAQTLAEDVLARAGFTVTRRNARLKGSGLSVGFVARDREGSLWYFDVAGTFTNTRAGLQRTEVVWRAIGHAHLLGVHGRRPYVVLTTDLPRAATDGDTALRAAGPSSIFDVIQMVDPDDLRRLRRYGSGKRNQPLPGFWDASIIEPHA